MGHDVFISHSSDDKTIADMVCAALESRGIRCWIAPRDILPGVPSYAAALMQAISDSRVMVLVFSAHANDSADVEKEVHAAHSRALPVVPLRIEDAAMSPGLRYYLGATQWLNASTPPFDAHLAELADTVTRLLEQSGVVVQKAPWARARTLSAGWDVNDCAFSPDGLVVLTADSNGNLEFWAASTGKLVKALSWANEVRDIAACAFSPDGQVIASAGLFSLRLWGNPLMQGSPDEYAGAGVSLTLRHEGSIRDCAFSLDGKRIVSASEDKTLGVWDAATGDRLATLRGHKGHVHACAFSPDGETVVSASADRTIKLWDTASGDCRATLTGHALSVEKCACSPDGGSIVSASWDRTLRLWGAGGEECLAVLAGHASAVRDCAFSPDGKTILSASGDETLKLWDAATGVCTATLPSRTGAVVACAFSPNGELIVSVGKGKREDCVELWVKT